MVEAPLRHAHAQISVVHIMVLFPAISWGGFLVSNLQTHTAHYKCVVGVWRFETRGSPPESQSPPEKHPKYKKNINKMHRIYPQMCVPPNLESRINTGGYRVGTKWIELSLVSQGLFLLRQQYSIYYSL